MSFVQHRQSDTYKAASAIADKLAVKLDTEDQIVLCATNNVQPLGLTDASAAQGAMVTIHEETSIARGLCAASVGANQLIGVASTNGALGLIAGASGVTRWAVGVSREAAQAGETFAIYIHPRQLSNLA